MVNIGVTTSTLAQQNLELSHQMSDITNLFLKEFLIGFIKAPFTIFSLLPLPFKLLLILIFFIVIESRFGLIDYCFKKIFKKSKKSYPGIPQEYKTQIGPETESLKNLFTGGYEKPETGNRYNSNKPITNYFINKKTDTRTITDVDKMSGYEFEKFLCELFDDLGYSVKHTGTKFSDRRGDFGADLIIEKNGIKTAIQAKKYTSLVGIAAIREVMGAVDYYNCNCGLVVTNHFFSNDAITQAKISNIDLCSRYGLIDLIIKSKK